MAHFPWHASAEVAAWLSREGAVEIERRVPPTFLVRRADGSAALRLALPLVQIVPEPPPDAGAALAAASEAFPARCLVLLVQAGAAALGLFEDEELVAHKVWKKYVTRGHGRAQPSYLRTRGKSRAGSRLRLRNAQSLLEDVNGRLAEWRDVFGEPDLAFQSAPVRLWADLHAASPGPPWPRERFVRIPHDVRVPSFTELCRVHGLLCRGVVERL